MRLQGAAKLRRGLPVVLVEGLQARILGLSAELVSEEGEESSGEIFWVVGVATEGLVGAVRISVTITVDPACCSGAVGVVLTIDVRTRVVGSGTGAVVVLAASSDSDVGVSRLVNRAEASAAARARAKMVE